MTTPELTAAQRRALFVARRRAHYACMPLARLRMLAHDEGVSLSQKTADDLAELLAEFDAGRAALEGGG